MAFAVGSRQREQAQINITPLVDVLLVLLVIFMVAAPVLSRPIPLQLPQAAPPDFKPATPPEPISLRIDAAGGLTWNGAATSLSALPGLFKAELARGSDAPPMLQIDADIDSDYDTFARVLAAANAAGMQNIGLVRRP
jgi:biopolymer transport protein ExbD